ncbi:hypothetical protein QW060_20175 [Myroides ceti]|uniref:Uncharacterized protein n=1 Tax=Paenimyroides ceti TaxID=395087 RepID=A0ABT8CXB9_9FLAO|nr:hypothetical protein [Paenimyroides ceti]MDN3708761.1 hypothetical protein [Paenimyroides ceti]MDN3709336.1 hypothetical protein [Paenimyroides ceti]
MNTKFKVGISCFKMQIYYFCIRFEEKMLHIISPQLYGISEILKNILFIYELLHILI